MIFRLATLSLCGAAGRSPDWLKIKTPHGREVEAKRLAHLRA